MSDDPIDALKALAHPARFAILRALSERERNVGQIERTTEVIQPALSQQLAILRSAGLVDARREAKQVFYSLNAMAMRDLASRLSPLWQTSLAETPNLEFGNLSGVAMFARMTKD